MRYSDENVSKKNGVVYTPSEMGDYVANQLFAIQDFHDKSELKILDPSIGKGNLVISILDNLKDISAIIKVVGYDTDSSVLLKTEQNLKLRYPNVIFELHNSDFLDAYLNNKIIEKYDYIIANPPYIRTQRMGAEKAQSLSKLFGLSGRIDIYYAFLICSSQLLSQNGVAGFITSNKFMTVKSGKTLREYLINFTKLHQIIDFGDTKLFNESVLPCVLIFSNGKTDLVDAVSFTSIYENREIKSSDNVPKQYSNIFEAIEISGTIMINNKYYDINHGFLGRGESWVISKEDTERWLEIVDSHTMMRFADIGKVRVGIKTTADNVFIGEFPDTYLELLSPLITHRNAGQITPNNNKMWKVLYTHTSVNGKKVVYDISQYPKSYEYLSKHREQLEKRTYIQESRRNWFEIWVPQNPARWNKRKIVFRDISEKPEFWLDESGAIVNGDCYWIDINDTVSEDCMLLALAVANSPFIEKYYDLRYNNKLYSGKRRYQTHYVANFPIPFIDSVGSKKIIELMKEIIKVDNKSEIFSILKKEIDELVCKVFTD